MTEGTEETEKRQSRQSIWSPSYVLLYSALIAQHSALFYRSPSFSTPTSVTRWRRNVPLTSTALR